MPGGRPPAHGKWAEESEGWVGELPEILTPEELAKFLREKPASVRSMLKKDETRKKYFPNAFRLSNRWKIPKQDVISFCEQMYGDTRLTFQRKDEPKIEITGD